MAKVDRIEIPKPIDFHLHLRDGDILRTVLPLVVRQFEGAIVMPNLAIPITTIEQALAYREEVLTALKDSGNGYNFTPLMTAYLTDNTIQGELIDGLRSGIWVAGKLYPANATTNSAHGVTDIRKLASVFKAMEEAYMPLLIHGELVSYDEGKRVDPFDREKEFLHKVLIPIRKEFPKLRIVFEHVTNEESVEYVKADQSGRLVATITAHHLWITRSDIFEGGIRPHLYCMPIAKTLKDRAALREAATSGDSRFFLGTDSAPHLISVKEQFGLGGIFTSHAALELYLQIFDDMNALDERMVAFMSENGRRFYKLSPAKSSVSLVREKWDVESYISVYDMHGLKQRSVHPFLFHGDGLEQKTLNWKMVE